MHLLARETQDLLVEAVVEERADMDELVTAFFARLPRDRVLYSQRLLLLVLFRL